MDSVRHDLAEAILVEEVVGVLLRDIEDWRLLLCVLLLSFEQLYLELLLLSIVTVRVSSLLFGPVYGPFDVVVFGWVVEVQELVHRETGWPSSAACAL